MNETEISFLPIVDGEDKTSFLKNCIRKNYRHIRKWAKRTNTNCFRVYDREIKEYPFAIDYYDKRFCVHYFSYDRENSDIKDDLKEEILAVLKALFDVPFEDVYWKTRIKRKKTEQYEKQSISKEFFNVLEYGVLFQVNLLDYLDTGLFLDHRETRKYVASLSQGKRLLNLFAYTCSFSVHAAINGSIFTKSVDMSNTYAAWGRRNFDINSLSFNNNVIVREDCLKFLDEEITSKIKYDIIVIDPPTISRSKKMDSIFDVQIDYISLITKSLKLLSKDGVIFFSTNLRKFKFDKTNFPSCSVMDVSNKTIPLDFHHLNIHSCWKITRT